MSIDTNPAGDGATEDRWKAGYDAARRHYRYDRALAVRAAAAWRDPQQDRGRRAIRQAWPGLAAILDETAQAADDIRERP